MSKKLLSSVVALMAGSVFAETLTVEQAVQQALAKSPQVQAARERKEGAWDLVRSSVGQMLPSVAVSDELQHYSGPFSVELAIPGIPAGASPALTIRDQNTNTFVASAKQPLLGLAKLSQDYAAAKANAQGQQAVLEGTERAMRESVESSFLRLFEARAAREVAKSSQGQLDEQLVVSKARVEAGALTTADVLRVEVARANIQQQELQAGVQESAARTQLLVLLALPLDAEVDFAEPTTLEEEATKPVPELAAASDEAVKFRADLSQSVHLLEGAEATSRSRLMALLPDIDLNAAYVHVDGQNLAQRDAAYIGVRASWAVWLWGAQFFAHRSAARNAEAARLTTQDATRQVKGEVSGRLDQLRAATAAIEVAKTAMASAEEAYRVTSAVVQAGSGTTTDLLDAQSALTQAKLNLVRSKYQQAMARVQLRRAMGG